MATRKSKTTSRKTTTRKSTSSRRKAPAREVRSPFRPILPLAVTLIIGLGMVLVYVSLDAEIEKQAKRVVEVEKEITSAKNEYSAQLNDWHRTLQPRNLIRMMNHRGVGMHFPEPREQIVLSNHDLWVRRQTAKASVSVEPIPRVTPPTSLPQTMQARSFEVVPASRYIQTDATPNAEELPAPPNWARPFLNATVR